MKKETLKRIEKAYYDTSIPGALSGPSAFGKNHPEFRKKDILEFFKIDFGTKSLFPKPKFSKIYEQQT